MSVIVDGFTIEVYDNEKTDLWFISSHESITTLHIYFREGGFELRKTIPNDITVEQILKDWPFLKLPTKKEIQGYSDE